MSTKKSPRKKKPEGAPAAASAEVATHETEVVDVDTLRPHPRNYRSHPEDQLRHIEASIREHGFYRNVVVARDGTILAGHGVVEAARRAGVTRVPIFRLPVDAESAAALKVLAGDNELGKFAESDDRALSELLRDIKDADVDGLLGTGFDEHMLASLVMVTRPASEIANMDAAAEYVGMPDYTPALNVSGTCRLMVSFDTETARDTFVANNALIIHKKLKGDGGTWTTYWPPRPRDDIASLKFSEASVDVLPRSE